MNRLHRPEITFIWLLQATIENKWHTLGQRLWNFPFFVAI